MPPIGVQHFPLMEMAQNKCASALPQQIKVETKDEVVALDNSQEDSKAFNFSVKSESDETHLKMEHAVRFEVGLDECAASKLVEKADGSSQTISFPKSEVAASEVALDGCLASKLLEKSDSSSQTIALPKAEKHCDTIDKECPPVVCLNPLQDRNLKGDRCFTEHVLVLTEPEQSKQEGRVCHMLNCNDKASPVDQKTDQLESQGEDAKEHHCTKCKKSYFSRTALKAHQKTHSGKQVFSCTCGQTFAKKWNLSVHQHGHSGRKPHNCHLCGKQFQRPAYLANHMQIHTGQKKEVVKRYSCEVCGKKFRTPCLLKCHQINHSEERPFKCDQCPKTFKRPKSLRDHQVFHGERMHVCTKCGSSFHRPDSLVKHQRIHTGQRPFHCPHCSKTFPYQWSLISHVKLHTA